MAEEEPQEDVHEEVPGAGASNRTLVWIMGVVLALFIIAGIALGKKEAEEGAEPPLPPGNARALVLPTDDAARTVVVAPCNTDPKETAKDAREDKATPNTVRLEFPRGGGDRALLVPDCSPKAGVSATVRLPSAAFVLPVGTKENSLQIPPLRAESQALVPQGGKARTIVISPCTGQIGGEAGKPAPSREGGANQDAVLEPEEGQGDLVVAPLC